MLTVINNQRKFLAEIFYWEELPGLKKTIDCLSNCYKPRVVGGFIIWWGDCCLLI